MDHHVPYGQAYVDYPLLEGMVRSQLGMAHLLQHEQYQGNPPGPSSNLPHEYAPGPPHYAAPPYSQVQYQPQQAALSLPRKKANRATQACQQCRVRKQKCDEQRPCGFCEKEGHQCEYKETAPVKQDATQIQILESLARIHEQLEALSQSHAGSIRKRPFISDGGEDDSPRSTKSLVTTEPREVGDTKCEQSEDVSIARSAVSESMPPIESQFVPPLKQEATGPSAVESMRRDLQRPSSQPTTIEVEESTPTFGGIPAKHTTSIDYLRSWPFIKDFYKESGLEKVLSIMDHEKAQGFLRLYGVGQTGDDRDRVLGQSEVSTRSSGSDDSIAIEPSGLWGTSSNDGFLRLDEATLVRLHDNYFRDFHILHPLLDRSRVRKMFDAFIAEYNGPAMMSSPPSSYTSEQADPSSTSGLSNRLPERTDMAEFPDFSKSLPPHRPIERTLTNAIVLLVMALGRIAEVKQPLGGPVAPRYGTSSTSSQDSPVPGRSTSYPVRPLAIASCATASSITPAPNIGNSTYDTMCRESSQEGHPVEGEKKRNIDVIPGLAYYATAADIMSPFSLAFDFGMGDELLQVWAYVLAGLYMGQLARVMESFSWIDKACKAWLVLKEKYTADDLGSTKSKDRNIDLVKLAFWTCLQLESDIRAEIDFPDPNIGQFEEVIGLPNGVFENAISTDISEVQDVYTFYSLQIQLRRTLNRAHNLVYGPENRERKLPVWLNEEFFSPGEMLQELQGFRKIIDRSGTPPSLRGWNDNDPTSDNINVSRIRGKYYGARYMIMRPFLQHALTYTISPSPQYQNVGSADQHIPKIKLLDLRDPSSRKRRENRLSMKVDEEQNLQIIRGAKICIDAAMSSTIAFDGHLPNRFLVTNIHGTALAQFGNMLVLSAAYLSWLGPSGANLVPRGRLIRLLERTINLMQSLAPLSRIMGVNSVILQTAKRKVIETPDKHAAQPNNHPH